MKNHTKVYLDGMKIQRTQFFEDMALVCEWCEMRPMTDVNHIEARGMGGSKTKDHIANLVGMCRQCHLVFEAKIISKADLRAKHLKNIPNG